MSGVRIIRRSLVRTLCVLALLSPWSAVRAEDNLDELKAQVERQKRQLEQLRQQIDAKLAATPAAEVAPGAGAPPPQDDAAVKKIVGDYLKDNPGAGMPPSVQTGFVTGQGFVIRSAPNPAYVKWEDDSRIPFELRVKARIMLSYQRYKVTDDVNHQTERHASQDVNTDRFADFSQLELKRGNLIFQGTAFDPDLRYNFNLTATTRGLPGFQNNKVIQTAPAGGTAPEAAGVSTIGGGVTEDHGVGLFEAWVAYDFHGCRCEKGCGPDCPPDCPKYCPTYTAIAGKLKPFFGLEEFLGNSNMQFCEFSMADLFFDADDDARFMGAGFQVKAVDDRFFLQALVTNGSDGGFAPNSQLDDYPGFLTGFWFDLGGTWEEQKKAWDLFGDCLSDIDYSCKPVARLGGSANLVPMDRRSLYGDAEQARFFTMPAGPGGTRLINLLNGDAVGAPSNPASPFTGTPLLGTHAVDKFDAYSFNAFAAAKYHGFSVCNEWWVRDLNDFRTTPNGGDFIVYPDPRPGVTANYLFPNHRGLVDYGQDLQGGYFLIPKKLELVARWSWVRGQSGDLFGDGTGHTVTLPSTVAVVTRTVGGVPVVSPASVTVVDGAFRHFHEANEYTVGVNYFFKRHLLKWQTDVGIYEGGNPVGAAGQSLAGFIGGEDGYLIRTQIQLAF